MELWKATKKHHIQDHKSNEKLESVFAVNLGTNLSGSGFTIHQELIMAMPGSGPWLASCYLNLINVSHCFTNDKKDKQPFVL